MSRTRDVIHKSQTLLPQLLLQSGDDGISRHQIEREMPGVPFVGTLEQYLTAGHIEQCTRVHNGEHVLIAEQWRVTDSGRRALRDEVARAGRFNSQRLTDDVPAEDRAELRAMTPEERRQHRESADSTTADQPRTGEGQVEPSRAGRPRSTARATTTSANKPTRARK